MNKILKIFLLSGLVLQSGTIFSVLPAPENLAASKKNYRYPAQLNLIHCLTWDAVQDATKYRIYVDTGISQFVDPQKNIFQGTLVGEVAVSDTPCAEFHGRCPGEMTYAVVAVDDQDDDGFSTSVTI